MHILALWPHWAGIRCPAGSLVYVSRSPGALRTGPEVHRPVEVANCSITTLRLLDGVRRLARANEVANLEWRGSEGY